MTADHEAIREMVINGHRVFKPSFDEASNRGCEYAQEIDDVADHLSVGFDSRREYRIRVDCPCCNGAHTLEAFVSLDSQNGNGAFEFSLVNCHRNLSTLHGGRTRYVAGALVASRRLLQRMGWFRRSAANGSRASDSTAGGAS